MQYKKIVYPALFLFSIWLFFRAIPLDTRHLHTGIFAVVGCIVSMVLAGMSLAQFFPMKKEEEQVKQSKEGDYTGYLIFGGIILFFFVYGITYISDVTRGTKKEFEQNGAYAMGEVVDGSSIKSRRMDLTNLKIKYRSEDGKEHIATLDISASEFSQYYLNQQLPIRYSKVYPYIIEVVKDKAVYAKHVMDAMPDLNLNDLLKVFKIKTPEATLVYLNVINKEWVASDGAHPDAMFYINYLRHIGLRTIGKDKLQYVHHSIDSSLYSKQLREMDFLPIPNNGKEGNLYKNKDFFVNIRNGPVPEMSSTGPGQQFTIVEINKLEK